MKLTVPTNLADITLEKYIKLSKLKPDDRVGQIATLCDISRKQVKRMEKSSFAEIEALVSGIESTDTDEFAFEKFVELEGIRYGMHPNLAELSVGEYVDLDSLCEKPLENLPKIMAILYRPVIEENFGIYKVAPYTGHESEKPFLQMRMPNVLGMLNFFLTLGISFVKSSLPFLKEEARVVT